jgi:anti-sigma B factor antagonist
LSEEVSVPPEPGTVNVDHLGHELWVVDVRGEHDVSTVGGLHETLEAIFAEGTSVVIDLSAATFIDSTILGELVRAQRRVDRDPGEKLAVVAPVGGFVARLFDLVALDAVVSVFESRADALRWLGGGA